jgi:hypothetical protein
MFILVVGSSNTLDKYVYLQLEKKRRGPGEKMSRYNYDEKSSL